MKYLLAVDQGSSKTIALVGDRIGNVVGLGYAGGACHSSDGMDMAMTMVKQACDQALHQAGASVSEVGLFVGGLTGADWDHEYPLLENALIRTMGIPHVQVYNDCVIAQRGGTDSSHGVVLCAGTAFNAAVQMPNGQRLIYGFYINDEDHGGTALGKAAVVAVCNAHAGIMPATGLTELLFRRIHGQLGPYKNVAPVLFETLKTGDEAAVKIVEAFGKSITRYAIAGLDKIGDPHLQTDVVLSGSIFKAEDGLLQKVITETLAQQAPQANVVDALYEPVVGAYLMGLDVLYGAKYALRNESLLRSAARFDLIRLSRPIKAH
jgi:N-acetylglucosamine kinase-like BadF-type ATPase